ncbi:hypothetical protein E4U31_007953 [Claviceps sp. LM219 group G6]|nr:hypothetical protein E4U31_007953 [Claviceps sp. LM219 group G6]
MAPITRVSARTPEAPGPQGPPQLDALPQQGVLHQGQPAAGPATAVTLTHEAEISRLQAVIAESNAQRNASAAAAAESEARRIASDAAAAQSAALLALATANGATTAPNAAGTPPGELLPPLVLQIAREMVSVAKEDVHDISTNKFDPWNLIRLHPILGLRPSPDEPASNVDITAGAFTLKKKTHTEKDYGDSLVLWLHSFINYMYIYERLFGDKHRDVLVAMNRFLEFITSKSQQFFWSKCLAYAMTHHHHAKDSGLHNAQAWLDHPRIQTDAYFQQIYALPAPASKKRQRSETTGTDSTTREVCRKFNSQTGCSYRNCKRSHECSSCGGSHAAHACART